MTYGGKSDKISRDLMTYQKFHTKNDTFYAIPIKKSHTAAIKQIGVVLTEMAKEASSKSLGTSAPIGASLDVKT